ncbi:3-carboxy-cis,cis-mucoante lactonizing enzyme, partial [Sporormia fimetaria CBS 119925]
LYCVDEGWNTNTAGNGSINTLEIVSDGSLKRVNTIETVAGPVAIQFYNEDKAVAMANYGGNASTTYTVSDDKKTFTHVQTESFFAVNGPRPDQKKSLHHQAVLDPTKKYMLFPDVGADAIRVYQIDPSNSVLTALPSIQAPAAYGPRHATFWTPTTAGHGQKPCTYLFVIHELINRVTSYKVDDSTTPVTFQETEASKKDGGFLLFDGDATWARPAEIAVSPDNRFITASNRNVTNMEVNGVVGDSLTVFKPCADGSLERVGVYPSGGAFPRHFSYSKDGGHIAVANTNTNSVAIFKRNIESGEIGD